MAKAIYRNAGETMEYTPSVAVTAGDIIVFRNRMIGYAKVDIPAGELGALALVGVYDVQKVGGRAFLPGDPVYWDPIGNPYLGTAGTGAASDADSAGLFMGRCVRRAKPNDTTVRVRAVMTDIDEWTESGSSQTESWSQ